MTLPAAPFTMYHASPSFNRDSILSTGLWRNNRYPGIFKTERIYIADSEEIVTDFAEQTNAIEGLPEAEWSIFVIEYEEFPDELYPDPEWGIPGVYYVERDVPPDHLRLVRDITLPGVFK